MKTLLLILVVLVSINFFIGLILNLTIRFINKNYSNLKNSKRRKDQILYFNIRKWRIECLLAGVFQAKNVFEALQRHLEFRRYLKKSESKIPV